MTATVHLDSQWRWTIEDTIRDFIPRTLDENFRLFEEVPHYVLSFEGAFRYMLAQEYYPEQYEELKQWVAKGRWYPAGGMLDAPDVNIVAPESLIRHILYGNRFFERELGLRSRDVFLPDCFGFSWALPSIAAHCDLEAFSSSKLIKWKAPGTIPFHIGRWRGPDGSEVLASLRPGGYGEGVEEDLSYSSEWQERLAAMAQECGVPVSMRYTGTGDRGGSPERESIDQLERSIDSDGPVDVECRPSDAILDRIPPEALQGLPVHDDELQLPTHGTGCWTSQAALKRWNRKNEQLASAAEAAAVMADWLGVAPYPRQRLETAWTRFLWHQMHDDLTGTSIPAAYRFTWNDEAIAANLFAGVLTDSVSAVAGVLDTRSQGIPIAVYNPLAHSRDDVVEMVLPASQIPDGELKMLSAGGAVVPTQFETLEDGRVRVLFSATVAPLSLTVFQLTGDSPQSFDGGAEELVVSEHGLENGRYRVEIDDNGDIASVFDKRLDRQLLSEPIHFELLRDHSMRWPAWEIRPETILDGHPPERLGGPVDIRVIERGPVRVSIEIERVADSSRILQQVRLARGGDRVEVDLEIDWCTRGRLLKASFPLAARNPEATYDLGLGAIRRGNNTPERYEVPAQQWAEITDSGGDFGAAVLSDSRYGWDKPDDGRLRLSLVRSPWSLRKYPHQRTQDYGVHRCSFALIGHRGQLELPAISRQAERFNQSPIPFRVPGSAGSRGASLSFFNHGEADIGVMALKKSEDSEAIVLRARNLGERDLDPVQLHFATATRAAELVDGCERCIADLEIAEGKVMTTFKPWSIRSFAIDLEPPTPARPLAQTALDLPFELRATSSHSGDDAIDFDGHGRSLPGELFPAQLAMGPIIFRLGPAEEKNCVPCQGQRIELPSTPDPTRPRSLWIVATSVGGPAEGRFTTERGTHPLAIASWIGFLAEREQPPRWGGLVPGHNGKLIRDDLAWLATHRHHAHGGKVSDEPYAFCYLFRYRIDIDAETRFLQLPEEPRIRLFAMTVSEHAPWVLPLSDLYGK